METGDLVVIGDSLAAGMLELNLLAEAQRWAYRRRDRPLRVGLSLRGRQIS
jgi:hypothetical protein